MSKLFVTTVVKEMATIHGHAPFLLRNLYNLNSVTKRLVVPYLRWRMRRMTPIDIQIMLDCEQVCLADLDFFLAETA